MYTKGSWFVFGSKENDITYWPGINSKLPSEVNTTVALFGGEDDLYGIRGVTREEAFANARLISKAPTMFELLEKFYAGQIDSLDVLKEFEGIMKFVVKD